VAKKSEFSEFQKSVLNVANTRKNVNVLFADPIGNGVVGPVSKETVKKHEDSMSELSPLVKSVLNVLDGPGESIERLAFTNNPTTSNQYQSLWRRKLRLLPDELLKRIAIQDDLVAAIANGRSGQISAFGRPQPDRHSTGFKIEPEPGYTENLTSDEKNKLQDRLAKAELKMFACGSTRGWTDNEELNLGQFLWMQARNAVVLGRFATEVINIDSNGGKVFHSFRPIDVGTIFRAAPHKQAAQQVRESALALLSQLKGEKLKPERFKNDEYSWVQVIEGMPRQAFTADECLVHNCYPITDIELDGYPLTPLDTVIAAVTMHINITTHNKLYFQNGRAARGMIVIKSDDIDETVTSRIRHQFNASINSAGSSWRTPIMGVGTEDDVVWQQLDGAGRDMEFQFLSDNNARVILSAFQMSPEELPGYQHLSRGSNSQALSESNAEYVLEAHRDLGLRPLLGHFQSFLNEKILPLIDSELAKFCSFKFVGLDADSAEKEAIRLGQDMGIHMVMDEVLERVEKGPIGKRWGGQFPLNPQWQAVVDKYMMQGDVLEYFFGIEGASKNPSFQFVNNPNWFQWQQLQMQMQQMQMQQQQMQQQAQMQQQQPQQGAQQEEQPQDLARSIDQLTEIMSKSEDKLPASKRRLLHHQRKIVENVLEGLEEDAKTAMGELMEVVEGHIPESKKK
jgi:hypothetical protein